MTNYSPTWKCTGTDSKTKSTTTRYIQALTKTKAINTARSVTRDIFSDRKNYGWTANMVNARGSFITYQQWHDYIKSVCEIRASRLREHWHDYGVEVQP